ncbi:serine protease [Streptomyces sp. NPDC006552]|uniref:serine protease n=1 Tax=Streptomyces sp. NPDC006552 TaxID=3157179 RepID=UPI0033ACD362
MRHDAWQRVMTVWCGGYGSGYLVAPDLVLTACHVVADAVRAGARVQVQPLDSDGGDPWLRCEVVWSRDDGPVDAALLRIVAADRRSVVPGPQRWGRLTGTAPGIPWQAVGFPDAAPDAGALRESEHLCGTLNPGTGRRGRRYLALVDGTAPADLGDSPWSGTSGAALFCGDLLTGVIVVDPRHWRHGRVEAVPIELLVADPAFRHLVETASGAPVTLESVELAPLLAPHAPHRPATPMGLLRADAETVPFHGRAELLTTAEQWCAQEAGELSVLLLTGPGGQGKTRFARELTRRKRADGWIAGLLAEGKPAERTVRDLTQAQAPVLLAVDYAEGRAEALDVLLGAFAARGPGGPVRLLLLARGSGEWWQRLRTRHPVLREAARPEHALPVLDAGAPGAHGAGAPHRAVADAFAAALSRLGQYQDTDWTSLAAALPAPGPRAGSAHTALERQMDVLAALLQSGPEPVAARAGGTADPEDVLLDHEWRYGDRAARDRGLAPAGRALRRSVTVACLVRPATEADALTALAAMPGLRDQPEAQLLDMAGWLADLYPPVDTAALWDSPRPDRLAERHLAETVRTTPDLLDAFLPALPGHLSYQALTALGRGWQQQPELGEAVTRLIVAHGPRLGPAAVAAVAELTDPAPVVRAVELLLKPRRLRQDMLVGMLKAMPGQSDALARHAMYMASVLMRGLMKDAPDKGDERRAPWLADLVVALEELTWRVGQGGHGRDTDAIFELFHGAAATLVREQGEEHLPGLVTALHLRAMHLGDTGRPQEALPLVDEAVDRGRSAADVPEVRSRLLGALNTRAMVFSRLDRHDEAVASLEEVGERLREARPLECTTDTYGWRGNLARELELAGRPQEAAAVFEEILPDVRRRAQAVPDSGRAELGAILTQAAWVRMRGGQTAAAAPLIEEGLGLLRPLARRQPGPYAHHLVGLLQLAGVRAGADGDTDAAVDALAEAEQWCRARVRHDASFRPVLAEVLDKLRGLRQLRGEHRLALRAANGVVQVLGDMPAAADGTPTPGLLGALLVLERAFADFGAPGRAVATLDRALRLYASGAHSAADPGLDRSVLLNRRGNRRAAAGDREAGLADLAEAVRLRREGPDRTPDGWLRLAASLSDLACLYLPDRAAQGLAPAEEAVRILCAEAARGKDTAARLGDVRINLAGLLVAAGHPSRAVETLDACLHAGQPPDPRRAALLWALKADVLRDLNRPARMLAAAERSVSLYASQAAAAGACGATAVERRGPMLACVCLGEALLSVARETDEVDEERLRDAVAVLTDTLDRAREEGALDLAVRALTALNTLDGTPAGPAEPAAPGPP